MAETPNQTDAIAALFGTAAQQAERRRDKTTRVVSGVGTLHLSVLTAKAEGVAIHGERPEILLQTAIVDARDSSAEGELIECIKRPWLRLADETFADPEFLFQFAKEPLK